VCLCRLWRSPPHCRDCFHYFAILKEVTVTLLMTVLLEGAVAIIYTVWREKPVRPILLTSVFGNLVTQSMLWIALTLSFRHYLLTLALAEILIWGIESLLLYGVRANDLKPKEAALLSLIMNGISLAVGWFLPV
jgi:predicted membrane protein